MGCALQLLIFFVSFAGLVFKLGYSVPSALKCCFITIVVSDDEINQKRRVPLRVYQTKKVVQLVHRAQIGVLVHYELHHGCRNVHHGKEKQEAV